MSKKISFDVLKEVTEEDGKLHLVSGLQDWMWDVTNEKFEFWDNVLSNNILEDGTDEQKAEVYQRLRDPTIYTYAFFRNPLKPKERFRLYPYQDLIINDPHNRIAFAAANQIGKSIVLCLKALTFAILSPGKTVLMVSKTLVQSKDLLRQINNFLKSSTLEYKYDIGDSETKTEITFRHYEDVEIYNEELDRTFTEIKELPQSRIICVPATGAALGYAADLILIDEEAFFDDGEHIYYQILQPRTYTTKGQIIVFSNPNGQQGVFWKQWNDPAFHHYRFNYLDCPTNTQEEFDKLCLGLTREQIDSTLLAVFTSPAGGFLTMSERKDMQQERESMLPSILTTPIFIFFDWGKSHDRTVRSIGIPIFRNKDDWAPEVYVYEMKEYPGGTEYSVIIEELKNLIIDSGISNIAMVGWDNTGVGRGIEDFVKRVQQLGIMAMPVEFSGPNKSRIYTIFKLLAEQRRIKIPYLQECDKQLSTLVFKKTSRDYLSVHHQNENDRDDFPDSLAGLCSLIISPDSPPISVTII